MLIVVPVKTKSDRSLGSHTTAKWNGSIVAIGQCNLKPHVKQRINGKLLRIQLNCWPLLGPINHDSPMTTSRRPPSTTVHYAIYSTQIVRPMKLLFQSPKAKDKICCYWNNSGATVLLIGRMFFKLMASPVRRYYTLMSWTGWFNCGVATQWPRKKKKKNTEIRSDCSGDGGLLPEERKTKY